MSLRGNVTVVLFSSVRTVETVVTQRWNKCVFYKEIDTSFLEIKWKCHDLDFWVYTPKASCVWGVIRS